MDKPEVFSVVSAAIEHYRAAERWWVDRFLAMPDHWHALTCFRDVDEMGGMIRDWTRFVSKMAGVTWQDGFFEHRLRTHESANEKWHYNRLNPVRKGLVPEPEDWKFVWMPESMAAR